MWEYIFDPGIAESDFTDELDGYGDDRWELVSCSRFEILEGSYGRESRVVRFACVFKRPQAQGGLDK